VVPTEGPARTANDAVDRPTSDRTATLVLVMLCLLCAGHALYSLRRGLMSPVLESQGFRESQTALTAYWLWRGGPWLAYETPVLGAPWSVPFELPVYQGLVAMLRAIGVPIATGGRLVAFAAYLGCLWPLWMLSRTLRFPTTTFLTVSAVVLAAPVYLCWGRTVLMETTAVFFGLLWLASVAALLDRPRWPVALSAFVAGSLGILVKATTFPAFAAAGGLLILGHYYRASGARWRTLPLTALALVGPFVTGFVWVAFTDAVKRSSEIGVLLTSDRLVGWNFGVLAQRVDPSVWRNLVLLRSIPEMFGYGGIAAGTALGGLFLSRRHAAAAAGSAAGFLAAFLVFMPLHVVHAYYLAAIALLALVTVGLALAAILDSGYRVAGLALLAATLAGQLYYFHVYYVPWFSGDHWGRKTHQAGILTRAYTDLGDGIIVLGIDWSSEIAYYSERRSVTVPAWLPADLKRRLYADPQRFLGSARFGAVVACPWPHTDDLDRAFLANRRVLASADGCRILAAER
jgi:hypothetical protein